MDFSILNPVISLDLKGAGAIVLPLAGTLLGLVYAANIYWLQEGISRLEITRSMLEDIIIYNAKIILDLLIAAATVSIFAIIEYKYLIGIAFWIFSIIFIKDLLKATAEQGYINILFSSSRKKIILKEKYSNKRKFFLKLIASGWSGLFRITILSGLIVIYPIHLSQNMKFLWMLSDNGAIIFMFSCSFIALIQIKPLLTQAFESRKEIERILETKNEENAQLLKPTERTWSADKRQLEEMIISERLDSLGIVYDYNSEELNKKGNWTSRDLEASNTPILMPRINVNGSGGIHLNLIIPYFDSDKKTREFIYFWTRSILATLAKSKTEVRHYTLSFFRKDGGPIDTHFGMMGGDRNKILKILSEDIDDEEFVRKLPRRYLTEAVAEF